MTLQTAINTLSQAANGHAFTTGEQFWAALRLGITALVLQQLRQQEGPQ